MSSPSLDAGTLRAYRANVTRFYIYKFLANLQLWVAIWVLYLQRERGLSLTQVTLLDAPFWLVIVLSEVPTGAIADRWGRKLSLLLGAVCFAAAIFVFGIATNFWWLLTSYLIWGVSMTLVSGADSAFLYESLAGLGRQGEFRKVLGRANACDLAASSIGSVIGPPIAAVTSLSFPIVISAGIALAGAGVILTFREPAHLEAGPRLSYTAIVRDAGRYSLTHAPLRTMIALRAVLMGAGMSGFIFIQPFLAAHDVPVSSFGLYGIPGRLAAIGGSLLAYRLAARLGERNLLFGLAAAFSGALLVLAAVPSVVVFLMFALMSFNNAVVTPVTGDYINRHSPDHLRATLMSVAQMASSLVLAIWEPLLGAVADHTTLRTMFLVAAVMVATCGAAALALWMLVERTSPPTARTYPPTPSLKGGGAEDETGEAGRSLHRPPDSIPLARIIHEASPAGSGGTTPDS